MDLQRTGLRPPSPPGALDGLEKQLSCPICLDMFTKPVVILPCQHNLCRGCASDLYDSRNPYRFSGGVFRCPTCRFEVVLDRHGVHGLQRNLLVENIIDILKQQQQQEPLKAPEAKEPRCPEHQDERINIYCVSCQLPTCSLCKVFGRHQACDVAPLAAVYQSRRAELGAAVDALAAANGRLQAQLLQLEAAGGAVADSAARAKQGLAERFDLLYAALERRKAALLERLGQEQDAKLAALRALSRRHAERLQAGAALTDAAVRALEHGAAADFLLTAEGLISQTRDAAKAALDQERPEPGYEKMDQFTVNTETLEALLDRMDFGTGDDEEYEDAEEDGQDE